MVRSDREIRGVLRRNIRRHGSAVEMVKLMEECGELVQAAARMMVGRIDVQDIEHLAEEMGDVEICMEQMRMIFPGLRRMEDEWIEEKLDRLEEANRGGR